MNKAAHELVAGVLVGAYIADKEQKSGTTTVKPFVGGAAAAIFTTLPDVLEPATSPNHRAFLHSVAFAGMVGVALRQLWRWAPETDGERFLKGAAQVCAGAYLIHLALDMTTKKSLPWIGVA